jgi:hypothetical protein
MIPPALALLVEEGIVEEGILDVVANLPIPLPIKKSRCIASATYRAGELAIVFQNGAQTVYPDIPISTVIAFVRASSPGGFYNSNLRGIRG